MRSHAVGGSPCQCFISSKSHPGTPIPLWSLQVPETLAMRCNHVLPQNGQHGAQEVNMLERMLLELRHSRLGDCRQFRQSICCSGVGKQCGAHGVMRPLMTRPISEIGIHFKSWESPGRPSASYSIGRCSRPLTSRMYRA